jgi:hypothetical protein
LLANGDLEYLGVLCDEGIRITRQPDACADDLPVRAFGYIWRNLLRDRMPPRARLSHEGRCSACGQAIRDPHSIASGLGSECRRVRTKLACN